MPDDSDKLNNEAMYGASRSMQVLRSHVGIGSFIEYLSVATRTIVQITSMVTGYESRQPVGRRTVSEHRRRRTISSRSDIRYFSVEIVGEGLSGKPRVGDRCTISTSTQSIVDDREAWSRPLSTRDRQKCFRFD